MTTEVVVPALGESVSEASVLKWFKAVGESISVDEPLVELETDKVTVEVPSPVSGVLVEMVVAEGDDVEVGALVARIDEGATASAAAPSAAPAASPAPAAPAAASAAQDVVVPALGESVSEASVLKWMKSVGDSVAVDEPLVELETDKVSVEVPSPVAGVLSEIVVGEGDDIEVGGLLCRIGGDASAAASAPKAAAAAATPAVSSDEGPHLSPAVAKLVAENNLDASKIPATGPKGNLIKEDVLNFIKNGGAPAPAAKPTPAPAPRPAVAPAPAPVFAPAGDRSLDPRGEERVKMSKLRKAIATRLKEAQNTAAMLTTFNEIDMTALMALRKEYKDSFEKKHGVKLGFMSFFVKAAVAALKELPAVNAEIYGDEIIYKNYYDIGIAVGTPQGLVVPVLRDADKLDFAGIEKSIADFGRRARDGKLTMAEMMGGTFTITNGGVFGSLMSTPIINPPQSGILGMHKIQKRPICDGDNIVVGNMMYVAHSYDHRIIDGREAVTFLVRIKDMLEDPSRLLIDV